MEIFTLRIGYMPTNCYIISADKQADAAVIDPGGNFEPIMNLLNRRGKNVKWVLITHGHFDHIIGARDLQANGAAVYVHLLDKEMLKNADGLAKSIGLQIKPCFADKIMLGEDTLRLGGLTVEVMHTPGHTKGSVCFVAENNIFSGDTLFFEDYGRTDLPGGSAADMEKSIKALFALEGDYKVYPGHGQATTLSHERIHNPVSR